MTSSSLRLPAHARHQRPTPSSSCAQPPQTHESEFGGGLRQTFASLLFCSTCCKAYVTNVSDPLKLLKTVTLGRDQSVLLHGAADDQEKVSPLVSLRSNHLQFSSVLCKKQKKKTFGCPDERSYVCPSGGGLSKTINKKLS